jgi:hypothetical protein
MANIFHFVNVFLAVLIYFDIIMARENKKYELYYVYVKNSTITL